MPVWRDRAEWLQFSSKPMTGPTQDKSAVKHFVIHYTGGNFDINADFRRQLGQMNDSYWASRGYALGYNWGVDPENGDVFPIRGSDIRCAANGCQANNVPWVAVLAPTATIGSPPTAATKDSIKNFVIPRLRQVYPWAEVRIWGHREIRPLCGDGGATACPGEPHFALIKSGFYNTPGSVPGGPTGGIHNMAVILQPGDGNAQQLSGTYAWDGVHINRVISTEALQVGRVAGVYVTDDNGNLVVLKNFSAAELQALITSAWGGPPGATAPGFNLPTDPAVTAAKAAEKAATDGATSTNKVMSDAFKAVDDDLTKLQESVDKIPTTPGGGGAVDVAAIATKTLNDMAARLAS